MRLVSTQGREDGVPTVRAEVDRAVSNAAANIVGDADREVVAVNERHYIIDGSDEPQSLVI